jgi:hypothetical protein
MGSTGGRIEHSCPGATQDAVEHTRPGAAQTAVEQTCPCLWTVQAAAVLFFSTERNSEHFYLSREWFGTEFRQFSVLRNSRNSVGINHLFRLPRNNYFVGNCQP